MNNIRSTDIFPDEETFQQIYSECLENEPMTDEPITPSYEDLDRLFEKHITAIQAQTFRYAYRCGYQKGINLSSN